MIATIMHVMLVFFFFSSRRRHTRLTCDWSSDVCSSDLSYRLPREPSTPRITIWRKLKRLGVAQISDGLIALPADARTREQLEWIAEEITDFGGTATLWLAQPATTDQERHPPPTMPDARV